MVVALQQYWIGDDDGDTPVQRHPTDQAVCGLDGPDYHAAACAVCRAQGTPQLRTTTSIAVRVWHFPNTGLIREGKIDNDADAEDMR